MKNFISTSKRNSIFAVALMLLVSMVTMFTPIKAEAASELGWGGVTFAGSNLNVYNAPSGGTVIGKIYVNESFTVLAQNGPAGYLWVDYSTSSGSKQGYIHITPDELGGRSGAPAKVINTSNVYYGTLDIGSNYNKAGAVYAGEYVSVIAVSRNWAYIEYNGSTKRKRGYTPVYNLDISDCRNPLPSIYNDYPDSDRVNHRSYFGGSATVYSGPTRLYDVVGSISNENIYYYGSTVTVGPYTAHYIEYYITGTNQLKSGFIID